MFSSSPALRTGDKAGQARSALDRWVIMAFTAVSTTVLMSGCGAVPPPGSDGVTGPEWRTEVRRSPGAATKTSPAVLTDVSIQAHDAYDRVVFSFDGDRPGYRIAYDQAGSTVLRVTITHIQDPTERRLEPETEAVAEVIQHAAHNQVIDTEVELAGVTAGTRPPFRVGLDVGKFYVDVAHPEQLRARTG